MADSAQYLFDIYIVCGVIILIRGSYRGDNIFYLGFMTGMKQNNYVIWMAIHNNKLNLGRGIHISHLNTRSILNKHDLSPYSTGNGVRVGYPT